MIPDIEQHTNQQDDAYKNRATVEKRNAWVMGIRGHGATILVVFEGTLSAIPVL